MRLFFIVLHSDGYRTLSRCGLRKPTQSAISCSPSHLEHPMDIPTDDSKSFLSLMETSTTSISFCRRSDRVTNSMSQPYLYLPFVQRILFEQWDINITEGVPLNAIAGQTSVGEGCEDEFQKWGDEASTDAEDFKGSSVLAEDFLEGDEDPDIQNNHPEDLDEGKGHILYIRVAVIGISRTVEESSKGPLDEGSTFNVYAHGSKPKINMTVISPPHSSTSPASASSFDASPNDDDDCRRGPASSHLRTVLDTGCVFFDHPTAISLFKPRHKQLSAVAMLSAVTPGHERL
ncbi:MAG: hypothetical protein NXY57DRAFT_962172 [Lentinula lateritia]|nr:MAG: hypothetical protein NXY57DRAFT_962172 [Lentinula lateritia]